jgi:ATP-dependent helicase HrpA
VRLEFPEALPVSGRRDEIAAAIAAHPVVIVGGETGSGKTTQLPKICIMAGRGSRGLIGHTQPRRLAATSVAKRIADELGSPLGTDVGYKIRFNERVSKTARIKLMTDGILLAETQGDPLLRQYDTIVIDEAHERSLNIDFLLGYLKQLVDGPRRDDLKLVITSATIDAERFAQHFAGPKGPAPVIEVSGRTYPVEIRWRPPGEAAAAAAASARAAATGVPGPTAPPAPPAPAPLSYGRTAKRDDDDETDLPAAIEDAVDELWAEGPGDILVFLPGEREIRETAEHLRRAWARRGARAGLVASAEILPLFSRLSAADQQRVFSTGGPPRVVLATNVAETSLTVPGIRYVVDTGLARVKRYRYRGKVEQLQIEPVSRAAANQRAGRCGRVADGICIRLYDEADFVRRPAFTDPEVLRSSLAAVILRMKSLRLVDIDAFPFVDPPPRRASLEGPAAAN